MLAVRPLSRGTSTLLFCGLALRVTQTSARSTSRSSIIVLGQSLNGDGSTPPTLLPRVCVAAKLHDRHPEARLIVTGGDPAGTGKTEAEVMAELLASAGVSRSSIVLERQAQNTVQNALLALPLVPHDASVVHLVTSDFHMPRSLYIFEAAAAALGRAERLRLQPHPAPMAAAGDASAAASAINAQGREERLSLELHMLQNDFAPAHLPTHGDAGGLALGPLRPLPPARLQAAVDDVRAMLAEDPGRGSSPSHQHGDKSCHVDVRRASSTVIV